MSAGTTAEIAEYIRDSLGDASLFASDTLRQKISHVIDNFQCGAGRCR